MSEHTQILDKAGLNWNVIKTPLQTVSGIAIDNRVAVIREDNDAVLGIVSPKYSIQQNEQLVEVLHNVSSQSGLELHSGGYFGHGEKIWVQLKSEELKLENDKVKGYISGFNSHDGSSRFAFGNSLITISCMNSWWTGYRSVETRLKHSKGMQGQIDAILFQIDLMLKDEQVTFEQIKRLTQIEVSKKAKELAIQYLFNLKKEDTLETISTNKLNKISQYELDLGTELASKGDTMWGLFNGVTRYTTHSMKEGDNSENKIFGIVGRNEQQIYSELVAMTQ